MFAFILSIFATSIGFFIGAFLLNGVHIKSYLTTIFVALLVAVLNATLGLLIKMLTLGLFGWGIFSLILSAVIIRIADYFLDDFKTDSFLWALLLAGVVALVNMLLTGLIG